jgi:hypothetical protein
VIKQTVEILTSPGRVKSRIHSSPPELTVRNKCITTATVTARRFVGIAIDHQAIEHGMMQASHFVFNDKNGTIALGVNDFFKAELMISASSEISRRCFR